MIRVAFARCIPVSYTHLVTAGDVMICKDGEEHMLENDGTEDLEFIALILYA